MRHLKYYKEHFNEINIKSGEKDEFAEFKKVHTGLQSREEQVNFAEMLEKKFNGLGLNADVTVKEAANCIYKWIEVVLTMNLTEYPYGLLGLMTGYINPSSDWKERDAVYFKLENNKKKYKHIKDGADRIFSLKLVFSLAKNINNLKIEDPDTWILLQASTPEEAYKKTIKEFTTLLISCSDTVVNMGTGFTKMFGEGNERKITGLRHFIIGYLNDKLTKYDRDIVVKHLGTISSNSNFYNAIKYQKDINPEIFNLLKIPINNMQSGEDMNNMGFYD